MDNFRTLGNGYCFQRANWTCNFETERYKACNYLWKSHILEARHLTMRTRKVCRWRRHSRKICMLRSEELPRWNIYGRILQLHRVFRFRKSIEGVWEIREWRMLCHSKVEHEISRLNDARSACKHGIWQCELVRCGPSKIYMAKMYHGQPALEYWEATQKVLQGETPIVRRPRLTEALLKKPPFRFLHDIITEVTSSRSIKTFLILKFSSFHDIIFL